MRIDLETLLHGNPSHEQVVSFFRDGDFSEEHYEIQAIERYLLTDAAKTILENGGFSLSDWLNGRIRPSRLSYASLLACEFNRILEFTRYSTDR